MIEFLQDLNLKKLNVWSDHVFIEEKLKKIENIHYYYIKAFQKNKKNKDVILGEFCRINS